MGQTPKQNLQSIAHKIDTFWIINCEHKKWFWRLIGHTAVIWKNPDTGILYVYESTQMGKSGIKGVQITLFYEWLKKYPGKVKIKPVTITNPMIRTEALKSAAEHVKKHLGKPYTDPKKRKGFLMLLKSVWDSGIFQKISTNIDTEIWFFCTMLVLNLFRFCKLVNSDINPTEWEPDDTRDEPRGKLKSVTKNKYVIIGKEIWIE